MNRSDFVSALFWLCISAFVSRMALQLGIGVLSNPGPGFVLFCASVVCAALSVALVVNAVRGKGGSRRLADSWRGVRWGNVIVAMAALTLYAAFLTKIGFLLATFGFMAVLYGLGKTRPWVSLSGAVVTTVLAYAIFHFGLQVHFPKGILSW
jgi:hypothetical protein